MSHRTLGPPAILPEGVFDLGIRSVSRRSASATGLGTAWWPVSFLLWEPFLRWMGRKKKMCNFGQSNHVPQISPISWLNAVGDQPSGPEPGLPVSPVTPFAIHSTNSLLSSLEMRHAIHIQQPRMIQLRNNPTWCTTSQLHTATTLRPHSSQSVASDQWPTQVAPWNQRTRVSLFFHICPMYQGAWDYYDFRIGTGCHQNHHASQ